MLSLLVPHTLKEENIDSITCILDGGRPAPNVTLNISGIGVSSAIKTESYNATTSLYTSVVSLTTFERIWNSKNVTCCRFNEWYKTKRVCSPTQLINLMYAPIIEFNISDSELAIYQGEQTHVKCSAESIPASNISWIEQTDVGNITMKTCQLQADCVITIEANLTQQRQFICQTHYLETSNQKTLTVNIFGKDEKHDKDLNNSASGDNSFIWIILGSCLAVLFVVVIVCLIARKKLRNTKAKLEANQARFSANPDGVRNKEDKLEDGNLNDGAHGFDDSEVTYSQPVKNKPSSNADATYSEVNKTGQSNSSASCSKKTQQDGQLLYADLDFDSNGAPLKGAAAKRRNSPTEYVAIDFVKTAAEQAKENEPTEADNIYANQ
ncbi:uncharacterized protein LOC123559676 isoform X2 [Mercenaria mercenaria]|uniref:uncharacterized protein LOC123559676 isoform X2 n=1 Tax=Mercenaria mercenaria TaxID=6596 RepID=UPI00234EA032|nr:uncharacterized protein LOC123559676 isoform X2 [Mercenaria mercenaria]